MDISGNLSPEEYKAYIIGEIKNINTWQMGFTDTPLSVSTQLNISGSGNSKGEYTLDTELHNLQIEADQINGEFKSLALQGELLNDKIQVNFKTPDIYVSFSSPSGLDEFLKRINETNRLISEQIEKQSIDIETLQKNLPRLELKADIKAKIKEQKATDGKRKQEDQAVEQAVANAEIDLPAPMVDLQAKQMADDFARRIMQQGMSVEQYFQFTGLTYEHMMEQVKPQAERRIKSRLVLEAVAAAENIEATEEDFDAEVKRMAEGYKMEADKLKELIGDAEKEQMKSDLAIQAAVDMITDAARL